MTFKDSSSHFQIVDVTMIEPDSSHLRQNIEEGSLKGLVNSIEKLGVIHPLVVRPAAAEGRYTVIVGERRRQAAILAGEKTVPVLVRPCAADVTLEVQVFENIGLGVRSALEPRDMANAIQAIAERFATPEEAAQYFARPATWLSQATAAANLSEKVTALLDSGKIASTSTAVQLERLAKKNEAKADSLIDQIEQLPEGEKVSKKVVDNALSEESGRRKKTEEPAAVAESVANAAPPIEREATIAVRDDAPAPLPATAPAASRSRVNPGKVRLVAEILGLSDGDEEEVLVRLIDEFLALKNA
ncbi:ParB/RepB/Spo0J family partition protein [Dechloromonas denitrificans]|uniref:ParB/RepB/Spo0J family partition protein n=1 Tax=Dechloromonas denitrificans TaxID=281362 RepID=UPI001CF8AA9B|nr:ParB/RepB/Spo0J family partition protein [Dechloromonas denitrificans]UCV02110.1 ParB/RepB/Spo0J family partition protein [Dechloromonas denitrificans]